MRAVESEEGMEQPERYLFNFEMIFDLYYFPILKLTEFWLVSLQTLARIASGPIDTTRRGRIASDWAYFSNESDDDWLFTLHKAFVLSAKHRRTPKQNMK